jgi:hypothetical protein
MKKRSIDARLGAVQVIIDSLLQDADILAALGYDEDRIEAGRTLYEESATLASQLKAEYSNQFQASEALRVAWDEADAAYVGALDLARVAFKGNPRALAVLRMGGERQQDLSGWLEQAGVFYANLRGDAGLMAAMREAGYDRDKLETGQALVAAVARANQALGEIKGEPLEVIERLDANLDELDSWMVGLKGALEHHPQWLEKLGFDVS